MSDYPAFAKIPRLFRDVVITEKIDGSNGLISIQPYPTDGSAPCGALVGTPDGDMVVRPGSRNRWLTPQQDNFGFAYWVSTWAHELSALGPGLHYGEWWGSGIQRGYGLTNGEKRFSLFNTGRWSADNIPDVPGLGVVPVLYEGPNQEYERGDLHPVDWVRKRLRDAGSVAAPGFMRPEGLIVYHTAARTYSKVTIENDAAPKGQAA